MLEETTACYSTDEDEFTLCCYASTKGCDGYIGCRACYAPITYYTSDAADAKDMATHPEAIKALDEIVNGTDER